MRTGCAPTLLLCSAMIAVQALSAAPIRVDYNGEFYSGESLIDGSRVIYGWQAYSEGAGGGVGPTLPGSAYSGLPYEDETAFGQNTYPGGHAVILGGSAGVGRYGLSQTINSTAGKHYFFVGTHRGSSATNTDAYYQWGLSQGSSPTGGAEGVLRYSGSSSGLGREAAMHSIIATGNQITVQGGIRSTAAVNVNCSIDGYRVYESDINVYSTGYNGGFEGARWNLTNWAAKADPPGTDVNDCWLPDGWLPYGGSIGQLNHVAVAPSDREPFGDMLVVDQYKGTGRNYFFQRVDLGYGPMEYTVGGWMKSAHLLDADVRIGIDPTGGIDPANVIWCEPNSATMTWEWRTVSAMSGANGVTVWLASGFDPNAHGGAMSSTGGASGWFDGIYSLPEPTSLMLLGVGVLLVGWRGRRR